MTVRVAINGFGRVGRCFLRSAHKSGADIEVVAINDVADAATLAALLRHDSVYGRFPERSRWNATARSWSAGTRDPRSSPSRARPRCPWAELGVDVVIESTGRFRTRAGAARAPRGRRAQGDHLRARQGGRARRRDRRARRELRRGLRPRAATTSSRTRRARPTAWLRWRRSCTRPSASATAR